MYFVVIVDWIASCKPAREVAMAVFFDKHVEFPRPSGGVRIHHAVEWHSKHAILAVASKCEATDAEGSVNFYIDEVE